MSKLYLNICIDTEGPLTESLGSTFKRISELFGLELEPSIENLNLVQSGSFPSLNPELSQKLASTFSKSRLDYSNNWKHLAERMGRALNMEFRNKYMDDLGNPLIYNFFVADFIGYTLNPRQKCTFPHGIYDFYQENFWKYQPDLDGVYWHYHHVPQNKAANEWSRCLSTSGEYDQILSRNLIDRQFFSSVFRAGGHIEREDLSYWLECWFPFDFSNHSISGSKSKFWEDWTRAPQTWKPYHPDFYDYQIPGHMKRSIFRCLDMNTREYKLDEKEVQKAFIEASTHPTVLSIYSHDYRDLQEEVEESLTLIRSVKKAFPTVELIHSKSLNAAQSVLNIQPKKPDFKLKLQGSMLTVTTKDSIWGTQPYLAFKSYTGEYFHDNFTRSSSPMQYEYQFTRLQEIELISVVCVDPSGECSIESISPLVGTY